MTDRLIQTLLHLAILASLAVICIASLSSASTQRELIREIEEICTIWGL